MNKACGVNIVAFFLLISSENALADVSQAVTFASQAGVVAGAAQACGQSIGVMTARTHEAINALSMDSADVNNALGSYQRAVSDSAASQALSQQLTCSKVVADFNQLPILQADYKQTVIAQFSQPSPTNSTVPAQTPMQASMQIAMTSAPLPVSAVNSQPASTTASPATPSPAFPVDNSQSTLQRVQQTVPNQQMVTANSATSTSAMTLDQQNAANAAAKLKLAQQLADMAQGLVATSNAATPYPEQNPAFTQYQASAVNPDNAHNGTNNPAYNAPLGVQAYPPGTNMNNATALIGEPGTSSYPPTTSSSTPTPYGP